MVECLPVGNGPYRGSEQGAGRCGFLPMSFRAAGPLAQRLGGFRGSSMRTSMSRRSASRCLSSPPSMIVRRLLRAANVLLSGLTQDVVTRMPLAALFSSVFPMDARVEMLEGWRWHHHATRSVADHVVRPEHSRNTLPWATT